MACRRPAGCASRRGPARLPNPRAIYITHAHFDHYFGLGTLLDRFPAARGVALPSVAKLARETHEAGRALAEHWLPGKTVDSTVLPAALDGDMINLDGHELHAIEVGQADIAHNTVLHVPSIDAVVAGDVVYNGVHQMLGVSGPDDWPRWIESVDKIAALNLKSSSLATSSPRSPTTTSRRPRRDTQLHHRLHRRTRQRRRRRRAHRPHDRALPRPHQPRHIARVSPRGDRAQARETDASHAMNLAQERFGCKILDGYGLSETSPIAWLTTPTASARRARSARRSRASR